MVSPALIATPLTGYLIAIHLGQRGAIDRIIFSFIFGLSTIIICGYLLSAINAYGSLFGWNLSVSIFLLATAIPILSGVDLKSQHLIPCDFLNGLRISKESIPKISLIEAFSIFPCVTTVAIVGVSSLWFAISFAPQNWDGLAYHLPRMAYYIQHGNIGPFDANYWAQVVHPKGSTNLLAFLYIGSESNECFTQLGQYVSYWVSAISISGTLIALGATFFSSLLSGMFFCLLTESLMEATTPQNDLLLCAVISAVIYGIVSWGKNGSRPHLLLSAISISISLSIKASVLLVIPSCAIIFLFAINQRLSNPETAPASKERKLKPDALLFFSSLMAGLVLIVMPSGYIDNIKAYGNPIGPAWVREMHSFEGKGIDQILRHGSINVLRFTSEFISFDGIPADLISVPQAGLKRIIRYATKAVNINLSDGQSSRAPFEYEKNPVSNEDFSYWGPIGFLLIWPINLFLALSRAASPAGRAFSLAAIIFIIAQAFSGPYDPWRGRYFLICAPFALIALGTWINDVGNASRRGPLIYIAIITMITCLSAFYAVFHKGPVPPRILSQVDRIGQLTSRHPETFALPLRIYEHMIPPGSTVAVSLPADSPEFIFFGENLNRRLIPINSFEHGLLNIPGNAQYLIYSSATKIGFMSGDVDIGSGLFLRRLIQ